MARPTALLRVALVSVLFAPAVVAARKKPDNYISSAVSAVVDRNYRRAKNPDGSFKPEYYAISFGGQATGTTSDSTVDGVRLESFRAVLETHLAQQNYLLAQDSAAAKLLLHVTWGVTQPFDPMNYRLALTSVGSSMNHYRGYLRSNPGEGGGWGGLPKQGEKPEATALRDQAESDLLHMVMEERFRDYALKQTARLLGYRDPIIELADDPARHAGLGTVYTDLREDIEYPRYYVVVTAYDFRSAVEAKEPKALWATRISIDAKGTRFDERYEEMIGRAGLYFGRDSGGLLRKRRGTVELGEPEVVSMGGEMSSPPDATRFDSGER